MKVMSDFDIVDDGSDNIDDNDDDEDAIDGYNNLYNNTECLSVSLSALILGGHRSHGHQIGWVGVTLAEPEQVCISGGATPNVSYLRPCGRLFTINISTTENGVTPRAVPNEREESKEDNYRKTGGATPKRLILTPMWGAFHH
jgi:hypothetical protein